MPPSNEAAFRGSFIFLPDRYQVIRRTMEAVYQEMTGPYLPGDSGRAYGRRLWIE